MVVVISMMTNSIQTADWRRSLRAEPSEKARFVIENLVLLAMTIIWQRLNRAGRFVSQKAQEADLLISLHKASRATPYPLTGCERTILCNSGEGCSRWHCPAKTVDFEYYVNGVMES